MFMLNKLPLLGRCIEKFRRRPFPSNLTALRHCRISYSQFGEDLYLTSLLGYEKADGTFVDVGCFHPVVYSNTYIFYQRGWRGVAIDPNPELAKVWSRFRPEDQFVNAAVAATSGSKRYRVNRRFAACNRLLAENDTQQATADEYDLQVPALSLTQILKERLKDKTIDLMSIDCEGFDLDVLGTLDFSVYAPRVIAVEDSDMALDSAIGKYLVSRGYVQRSHIGLTKIFARA